MFSHGFFSKLCLVKPVALFIVFVFVLIIPGNAILLIGGNNNNNNYFGTTSNLLTVSSSLIKSTLILQIQ